MTLFPQRRKCIEILHVVLTEPKITFGLKKLVLDLIELIPPKAFVLFDLKKH